MLVAELGAYSSSTTYDTINVLGLGKPAPENKKTRTTGVMSCHAARYFLAAHGMHTTPDTRHTTA